MSDDDDGQRPPQPRNPFIRFKNHVNTRIGTGISILTGGILAREEAPTRPSSEDPYTRHSESEHIGPSCADRKMHPFDRARRRREPAEGFQYWDRWSQLDPYSPYNLRHLPQPIPSDLPRDVDAGHFGFHEAFEDLMAVSGIDDGRLMDLRARADLKKSILKKFASGEPSLVWVTRLHHSGLLPPPFIWESPTFLGEIRERSGQAVEQEQHRPASILEWLDERRNTTEFSEGAERRFAKDIEVLKGLTAKMFQDSEGKGMSWDDMMEKLDKDFVINPAGMIRKAEQSFRDLEKEIEKYANELTGANTQAPDNTKASPCDNQSEPSTEQDLFSMIRSAVAEADKSFNNFAKSITDMASPYAGKGRQDQAPGSETVEYDSFGGKTVTTTSEHTDVFGNIHSKTEVRRLNAGGEEVGLQTHYSVHSSRTTDSQQAGGEDYNKSHANLLEQQNKERLGMARDEEHKAWSEHTEESTKKSQQENVDSGDKNGKSSGWFWR